MFFATILVLVSQKDLTASIFSLILSILYLTILSAVVSASLPSKSLSNTNLGAVSPVCASSCCLTFLPSFHFFDSNTSAVLFDKLVLAFQIVSTHSTIGFVMSTPALTPPFVISDNTSAVCPIAHLPSFNQYKVLPRLANVSILVAKSIFCALYAFQASPPCFNSSIPSWAPGVSNSFIACCFVLSGSCPNILLNQAPNV
jgi:hypothetical protein